MTFTWLSRLAELEKLIAAHGEALDAHSRIIDQHEQNLRDDEMSMVAYEPEGGDVRVQETRGVEAPPLAEIRIGTL